MARQVAEVQIHATDSEFDELKDVDVSVDLIDDGLYLGNVACAHDQKMLQQLGITHILTLDLVPLPRTILDRPNLTFRFVQLSDMPKEDLITHLPETNNFIREAIASGGTVLVHCFFGVSRSAAVVIAYIMEKYGLCYEEAYVLVKSKRRFVSPNVGFVAQLKLFGHMGYTLNREDPRFKQFRLKMAGQKLKQVKILPQLFADLVKPDPGLTRERPDPRVYRCRRCRRVVASQRNIIPHLPRSVKVELAKKGIRPPPSKLTGLTCAENGELLIKKLKSLACQILEEDSDQAEAPLDDSQEGEEGSSQHLDGYSEGNLVDGSIAARDAAEACRLMWFVEPMAWMTDVTHAPQGKLHCPKCRTRLGSFSWVMGELVYIPHLLYTLTAWMAGVTHAPQGKLHCPKCRTRLGSFSWVMGELVYIPHLLYTLTAWMAGVTHAPQGKLHCPKCRTRLGSFSWVMGCKCPCGQKVAPAFYMVPSKVEWSNIVQNVQVTV